MRIKKITVDTHKSMTYDIEVPDVHNYILADGTVVHNSTVAAGTTNGVYPIRDYDLNKTNDTMVTKWVAPNSTKLRGKYEIAWDVGSLNMLKCYAVMQKFTDQSISADLWRRLQGDQKVGSSEMIEEYLTMVKYGIKTRYYLNSLTAKGMSVNTPDDTTAQDTIDDDPVCESCSL